MTVTYRLAQPGDVERIAVAMCDIDVAECAAGGHTPWQALSNAKRQSVICWTGEIDGWPEAMFGVVPGSIMGGHGYPWFLGSNKARSRQRLFLTDAPRFLAPIETVFPRLEGCVAVRNTAAIRWLRRLGFVVEDHAILIMRGEPMHRFVKGFS